MKINRLMEITVLLLNKEKVTARELAERFEVSPRTIYRDIETLSMSGVPVYMSKGRGGGISLVEDYSISKALLSVQDKEALMLALKTLQVTKYPEINLILEKIGSLFKGEGIDDWIQIDFSYWGSNPNEEDKFSVIKAAILKRNVVNFDYVNSYADKSNRTIEPMKLMYKGQAWYLYGYCRLKQDFRIFRISRIKKLKMTDEHFERREMQSKWNGKYGGFPSNMTKLKLRFQEQALYRVFDDFGEEQMTRNKDSTVDVETVLPVNEWVYGYLLSYGNYVEVLEPERIRKIVLDKLKKAVKTYEEPIKI